MIESWEALVNELPILLSKLESQPMVLTGDIYIPQVKGIYVFYENGKPIYTGRTNKLRNRIKQHCDEKGSHNSATFTFNLAKEEAINLGLNINGTRVQLENDERFSTLFLKAKDRVSKMSFRFVEINSPEIQAVFEVYASIALGTKKYNSFENH